MVAPATAPIAPPTHAPLWWLTLFPMTAPTPAPSSAPSAGSPADARVAIVAVVRVVAMSAITRGLFRMSFSSVSSC